MRKYSLVPIAAGVMLALAGSAQAATKTSTFNVNANVAANCFIQSTDLTFPDYDGTAVADSTSTLSVRCSKNAPYSIALNAGTTSGGTLLQRLLDGPGADTLEYNLYTDALRSTIWGNNAGGTGWNSGSGTGLANWIDYTVYGRIANTANNQAAGVGAYADVITATVTY